MSFMVPLYMFIIALFSSWYIVDRQPIHLYMAFVALVVLIVYFIVVDDIPILRQRPIPVPRPAGEQVRDNAMLFFDIIIPQNNRVNVVPRQKGTDVHDHTVQRSIIEAVKRLREWEEKLPKNDEPAPIMEEIKEYIFNGYDGTYKTKEQAYSTVRSVERIKGKPSNLPINELELLQLVWRRINAPLNEECADELKSNLIQFLADGTITIDNSYCLTGRVTRMIQALESIDKENIVNIKSAEQIKEEMTFKAGALRDVFLEEHPSFRPIYEEDKDDDATKSVNKEIREHVHAALRKEYVESDLLTHNQFEQYSAPLIEVL